MRKSAPVMLAACGEASQVGDGLGDLPGRGAHRIPGLATRSRHAHPRDRTPQSVDGGGAVIADGPIKAEKTLSGEVVARCDYGCCQTRM
jgi:hypothetical protein